MTFFGNIDNAKKIIYNINNIIKTLIIVGLLIKWVDARVVNGGGL